MEKKGIKWQIIVATLSLCVLMGTLLSPWMEISGNRYLTMAVAVNKKAESLDPDIPEAHNVTDNYERGTSKREALTTEYQKHLKGILGTNGNKISMWKLALWCITTDGTTSIDWIDFSPSVDFSYTRSEPVFMLMALLLIFPAFFAFIVILAMWISGKTQKFLLFCSGIFTITCTISWYLFIPELLWQKLSTYIQSFNMISEQVLAVDGVGLYCMQEIFKDFSSWGVIMNFAMGIWMLYLSFMFLVKWKPEKEFVEIEIARKNAKPVRKWEIFPNSEEMSLDEQLLSDEIKEIQRTDHTKHKATKKSQLEDTGLLFPLQIDLGGMIRGEKGSLERKDIEIRPNSEMVLGSNPDKCDISIDNPDVPPKKCGIRFDHTMGQYKIIDYSGQGTELSNGKTATSASYVTAAPGTLVYISGKDEIIRLG